MKRGIRFFGLLAALALVQSASAAGTNVRLTNDDPTLGGYVSNYTINTGIPYTDNTLTECSRSRGRQNEPAVAVDPRNTQVIVGSSNDYCGVYNDGSSADGAPIPSGPIWLGYYRSENAGRSFVSSLVPGYPGDTSPYAAFAQIRTASAGDPVLTWDAQGRLFAGSESSGDPAGTKKTFGDEWVATYENPAGPGGATINDGKKYVRTVTVAKGSAAPNLLGLFNDKTAIQADRSPNSPCQNTVYFAYSRFNNNHSNIYFVRSTDHGATFSNPALLTTSVNSVQDPEISVTPNGHVYVTFDAQIHQGNRQINAIQYVKSMNCGQTFSPVATLTTYETYDAQDVPGAQPAPAQAQGDDPASSDASGSGSSSRDCGDFSDHCQSGYTFFRQSTDPRSTADQYGSPGNETVYVVYNATIPGTEMPTGTTYGSVSSGVGSQEGIYFLRLNGATGAVSTPTLIDATDYAAKQGQQLFPAISADGGTLHVLWWDSRNDPCYSPARPIGNCADRSLVPSLDVYATASANGGATFAPSTRVSTVTSNPNYEQFDGRQVPFAGDYLYISSLGSFSYGTWTDWRNTVVGTDARESATYDNDTGALGGDVLQCRTQTSSGAFTGDLCPRAGGLDQNIYGAQTP